MKTNNTKPEAGTGSRESFRKLSHIVRLASGQAELTIYHGGENGGAEAVRKVYSTWKAARIAEAYYMKKYHGIY